MTYSNEKQHRDTTMKIRNENKKPTTMKPTYTMIHNEKQET